MDTETQEIDVDEKAKELSDKLNTKIIPFIFTIDDGTQIVGFLKDANRVTKMRVLDMLAQSKFIFAGELLLTTCLIKEESDPRILSNKQEDDNIYTSACLASAEIAKIYPNEYKKK